MVGNNPDMSVARKTTLWVLASFMLFSTIWLSGIAPLHSSICANGEKAVLGFEYSNTVRYLA